VPTLPTNVPLTRMDGPPASSLASFARILNRTGEPGRQLTSPRIVIDPRERSLSAEASSRFLGYATNIVPVRPVSAGNAIFRPRRASVRRISRDHHGGENGELCWMRSVRTAAPSSQLPHQTYVLPATLSAEPSVHTNLSGVPDDSPALPRAAATVATHVANRSPTPTAVPRIVSLSQAIHAVRRQ
jgi:hypothetical protein